MRSMRVALAMLVAISTLVIEPSVPDARAVSDVTLLTATSDAEAVTWVHPDTFFHQPVRYPSEQTEYAININSFDRYGSIVLAAPSGEDLGVGTYDGATTAGGSAPMFKLHHHTCSQQVASFDVLELAVDADLVTRLAVDFAYRCTHETVEHLGSYRYHSTIDVAGPHISPSTVELGTIVGGTTSSTKSVSLTNRGALPFDVATATLSGERPDLFTIVDDACSGVTIASGESCSVDVDATAPVAYLDTTAILTFSADTPRPTFGVRLHVVGLTRTSVEITTPSTVESQGGAPITAQVSPVDPDTTRGSVGFYIDGVSITEAQVDETGLAWVSPIYVPLTPGTYEIKARFIPGITAGSAAESETTKTVTVLKHVGMRIQSSWPATIVQGTVIDLDADMSTATVPTSGTFRIRNETTGQILASTSVTSTNVTLKTPLLTLPLGSNKIVAEFIGDPTFYPKKVTYIQTVTKDVAVSADGFAVSPSPFYPAADGYRDKLTIKGTALENVRVTISIYNSGGTRVRSIDLGTRFRGYSTTWNGRRSDGTAVPAGRYKVTQQLRDTYGNVLRKETYITVSWRKVRWITTSSTKSGGAYSSATKVGSGTVSRTGSSFSGGVKLSGGTRENSYAVVRWNFTLRSALAYKGLSIQTLGKGTRSSSRAILAFGQDSVGALVGPGYRWWSRTGGVTGHVVNRVVTLDIETDGPMSGAFDVAKTRVVYTYAVWQ